MADVGFGNMTLDFSNKPLVSNKIKGSVGAGNLTIVLPSEDTPVLVKIKDSWLCSVKVPSSLRRLLKTLLLTPLIQKVLKPHWSSTWMFPWEISF